MKIHFIFIFIFFISSCLTIQPPTFNQISIPLNLNYLNAGTVLQNGQSLTNDNLSLKMSPQGVQLFYYNNLIWQPFTISPPNPNAIFTFGTDGNMCLSKSSTSTGDALWCRYTNAAGGIYLNILPEGSYGREWGMVIQTSQGKMIWGVFGNSISTFGDMPLIPGNFIDRLDPSNNAIAPNGLITNGQNYLRVNTVPTEAIGYYLNGFPYPEYNSSPVWTISKTSGSYSLYFLPNSSVCVGLVGSMNTPIWCAPTTSTNSRYVVVPLPTLQSGNDITTWKWVILSDTKDIIYTQKSTPTFDRFAVPLTPKGNIIVNTIISIGQSIMVGNASLVMTNVGIKLMYYNKVVWQPFTISPPNPTAYFILGTDGNMCMTSPANQGGDAIWCSMVHGIGAMYLNILPEGSYGREWGLILQTSQGKMVWGKFGKSISDAGILPLIPGNYIHYGQANSNQLLANGFITNGENYLISNSLDVALQYFSDFSSMQSISKSKWSISKQNDGDDTGVVFFGNRLAIQIRGQSTPYYYLSNSEVNVVYAILPLPGQYTPFANKGSWCWVMTDANMSIVDSYSDTPLPTFNQNSIPLTKDGYMKVGSRLGIGSSLKLNNTVLRITPIGLTLSFNNKVVWQPFTISPPNPTAYFNLGTDGNMCVTSPANEGGDAIWCRFTNAAGGMYLNILPEGSYGREWGLVLQTSQGKMVWGVFGNSISTFGDMPLIPGNFIDRLDPSNNAIAPNGLITNGQNYLRVNTVPTEAIGYYLNGFPYPEYNSSPVWTISKISGSYSLYFLPNSSVCVGLVGSMNTPIWCAPTTSTNSRYVVVPPLSTPNSVNNENTWDGWAVLSDTKKILYSKQSNRVNPTFDQNAIPLTPNGYIEAGVSLIIGQSKTIGNIQLLMTNTGIVLKFNGEIVFQPFTISPPNPNAVFSFGTDGNMCLIKSSTSIGDALWCRYTNAAGGIYLNILPEGSYGREWGIVIQTSQGKMIWGEFGNSISTFGDMPLIPGNFIDRLDPNNNAIASYGSITNGQNYLRVNTVPTEAIGYYLNGFPYPEYNSSPVWTISKTSGSYSLYFLPNSSVCVGLVGSMNTPIWCTPSIPDIQRYVVVPLPNSKSNNQGEHWRWVVLSGNKTVTFSQVKNIPPVFNKDSIPLTPLSTGYIKNGQIWVVNDYVNVGNIQLIMLNTGIALKYKGEIVWQPNPLFVPDQDISFLFSDYGEICVKHYYASPIWCIATGQGGMYLNILPEGSYGRQWGLVVQNSQGKMIWGVFGNVTSTSGIMPLIPGNYIDRLDPNNNKLTSLTNGADVLSYSTSSNSWVISNIESPDKVLSFYKPNLAFGSSFEFNDKGQFGSKETLLSTGQFAQWVIAYDKPARYFVSSISFANSIFVPGYYLLDNDMNLVGGWDFTLEMSVLLEVPNFVSSSNPSLSDIYNLYTSIQIVSSTNSKGSIIIRNEVNGSVIAKYDSNTVGSLIPYFSNSPSFTFSQPIGSTCSGSGNILLNVVGDNLFSFINNVGAQYYLGFSYYSPELLIIEYNSRKIVYVSSFYDSSFYNNNTLPIDQQY